MSKCVVVLSGGQDSATALLWALNNFNEVHAITFAYGQRNTMEIYCAKALAEAFCKTWTVIDLSFIAELGSNALTDPDCIEDDEGGLAGEATTFVPGRNLIFLTVAASFAANNEIVDVVHGISDGDEQVYPDCRRLTLQALATALDFGMGVESQLHGPLMGMDKEAIWHFAAQQAFDGEETIIKGTHSCHYDNDTEHVWGTGCGVCGSCISREKGFARYRG